MADKKGKKDDKRLKNLKPFSNDRSENEAREKGRKGGINSGIKRRKLRDIRQALRIAAQSDIGKDLAKQLKSKLKGYEDFEGNTLMLLASLMTGEALEKHNYKAREQFLNYMGLDSIEQEDKDEATKKENELMTALTKSLKE